MQKIKLFWKQKFISTVTPRTFQTTLVKTKLVQIEENTVFRHVTPELNYWRKNGQFKVERKHDLDEVKTKLNGEVVKKKLIF